MQLTLTNPVSMVCTSPHVVGNQPEMLHRIVNPGVNLCLWQRPAQEAVIRELSSLKVSDLPDVRCSTSLESFDDDVDTLLQKQGLDPLAFSNWRIDLRRIADHYFGVSDDRDVTLRLVTTENDDCRRFHVDYTHLRLLCTYRGQGTEWLTNKQVDRFAQSSGAPNDAIIRFGKPSQFDPFWVGILKGAAYPGNAGHALLHRSHPIAASADTRVVLCLVS